MSDQLGTRLPRPLRPFRVRGYRMLTTSLAASLTASGWWLVAIVWQVIELGGGPVQLSLVMAAAAAGLVLAVLAGGVAADRYPRRRLLIGVETARTAAAGLAAVLALTGVLVLWQLVALAFLVGVAEGFFYPAYSAILPSLLPDDDLLAANGIEGALRPAAEQAIGPMLAAIVVAAASPGLALAGAAAVYLLALVPLLAMPPVAVAAGSPSSPLEDLREGIRYVRRTGWLFATLAFAIVTVLVVVGPIEVLVAFAVRDRTGAGAGGYSLVLAGYGVGGALGSIAVASRRLPRRYLTVMLLMWGLGSAPLAVMGVTDSLFLMAVAAFVVGVTDSAAGVIWGTLLQRRVPRHLLGRVSSLDFFVSLALMPVSMAVAGPVGESLGLPLTFAIAGAIPVVAAGAAIVGWRLWRDEITHPLDDAATPVRSGPAPTATAP